GKGGVADLPLHSFVPGVSPLGEGHHTAQVGLGPELVLKLFHFFAQFLLCSSIKTFDISAAIRVITQHDLPFPQTVWALSIGALTVQASSRHLINLQFS